MSLLNGRSQLARVVLNPNPMDFCTKDLLTTTSERIVSDDYMITWKVRNFPVMVLKNLVVFPTYSCVYTRATWHSHQCDLVLSVPNTTVSTGC